MDDNLELFDDTALARNTDPDTSHAAAGSLPAGFLKTAVYEVILKSKEFGCTVDDIVTALRVPKVSVSPRLKPLINDNLIYDSGRRRTALSGHKQRVCVATKYRETDLSDVETVKPKPTRKELEQRIKDLEADRKKDCTDFFYWWFNQPGTNTQAGYDEWLESKGAQL